MAIPIDKVSFTINGKLYNVTTSDTLPIETSLNTFIRCHAHLPGTKFMCLEGGCGICIVSVTGVHPNSNEKRTWAVNSCLFPVFSCHGLEITTIEGLGNRQKGYHKLQKVLTEFSGTQCGYCSPGMIMNMYSLIESTEGVLKMEDIENSFGGNICRCTGYRPILDAFKSLAADATEDLKEIVKDIEDLNQICTKSGEICKSKCTPISCHKFRIQDDNGKIWYRVTTIQEILDIFTQLSQTPNKKYMLVHGNTAHGVYRSDPNIEVFIDVTHVNELHSYAIQQEIELGANMSITDTMNVLKAVSETHPEFEYCKKIVKHIDLVANVPVRNSGTIAGNLSIKHEHNAFPSDIFLLLETVGALLTIVDHANNISSVKPSAFLQQSMKYKLITKIKLRALPSMKFLLETYKIMPRAQNAHAYVNAGFLLEMDDKKEIIIKATIVYGGINPNFVHATALENYLAGKSLFTNSVIQTAIKTLQNELNPDWILPDPSSDYRKYLSIALFYKFILSIAPVDKTSAKNKSGAYLLKRPLSSGTQEFDTKPLNYPLTQPIPKLEGLIQCAGEAEFVNDIPTQPNELWGAFVLATNVGATILRIDAGEALNIKGVHHFFSAKDIPGKNTFTPLAMLFVLETEEIFCSSKVKYNGQPCGMILADTMELAYHAVNFVQITYGARANENICPTLKDVIKANEVNKRIANDKTEFNHSNKEIDEKVNETGILPKIIIGNFEMGGQYHFTMETQTCVTIPGDEGLNVYSSSQWMDVVQVAVAETLKIPVNTVNVFTKRVGGAYGCKMTRAQLVACASALGAFLTNRPVRLVLKIETNMEAIGKRFSAVANYKVIAADNGLIVGVVGDCIEDFGHCANEPILPLTLEAIGKGYIKAKWGIVVLGVKTDAATNTWCRAPGTTEATAITENIIEHVAHAVKRDPVEVKLLNMLPLGKLKQLMIEFVKSVDYDTRKKGIDEFNAANRWIKRGIAVVPLDYLLLYLGYYHALVSIYHRDGTVSVTVGGTECGQGLYTKVAQVAAFTLGISLDFIKIKQSNTLTAANDFLTGSSSTSESVCLAVKKACEELLSRLKAPREINKNLIWPELIKVAHTLNVDLTASAKFKLTDALPYTIYGFACAEMELDVLTGNHIIKRVDILEDVGESMSPKVDVGQIEGAFMMGVGYWLQEWLVYDNTNGKLLTNRTWNYKVPGAKDIPVDFRIKFFKNSSNSYGVLRSKATGEPALSMSVVVLFALQHAIRSARQDAGFEDKWFHLAAPTTVADVFTLCNESKIDNYVL